MPILVDTFNVLHLTGVLPPDLAGLDVEELRGVIALSRYRRQMIKLVCDGVEPVGGRGLGDFDGDDVEGERRGFRNISMMWSGAETDADSVIEILVAQDSAPRRLTVVTSDRRLGKEVRKRRVRVMPSEVFLENLSADFRENVERADTPTGVQITARPAFAYDVPLAGDSVRWWLSYLGMDADDPRVEGQRVLASSAAEIVREVAREPDRAKRVGLGRAEVDPIRWWLCYFGLDPDALPAELRVSATRVENEPLAGTANDGAQGEDCAADEDGDDGGMIEIDAIDPEALL